MKQIKITVLITVIVMSLLLTSCLRDDTYPPVTSHPVTSEPETSQGTDNVTGDNVSTDTEGVTEGTKTDITTESTYVPPEEELSESVIMWINSHPSPKDIIMTPDGIRRVNDRMMKDSLHLNDLTASEPTVTPQELKDAIAAYGDVPHGRYDIDGSLITDEHRQQVRENMASDAITDVKVKLGIITSRANLRSFPDDKPYRKGADNPYDSIQQTELHVASPVWVLHTSRDGAYSFVRAYNYSGWVKSECIATTDEAELWRHFASPESFVRVTGVHVYLANEEVDMGVRLPLSADRGGKYYVDVPSRDTDGNLCIRELTVSAEYAVIGDLPYTYENFIKQAFKYEGVMYSWGGLDTGVDCSGFIGNVMRTFGFMLPRDTRHQEFVSGTSSDVRWKSHSEIAAILSNVKSPAAVYYPGHVLFYLGYNVNDGLYYFIHAPRIGEAVGVTAKSDLSGMNSICVFDVK